MIRQFSAGLTHSLYFNFWDVSGARTVVDNALVDVLTPEKNFFLQGAGLTTTDTPGEYSYALFLPVGATIGHWFARATGLTTRDTLYSESQVFEVIDYKFEPLFVGFEEFRTFLNLEDDDRSNDVNLRQVLQTAIELVEGHTHRHYGIYQYYELIEVKNTDRIMLKHFPVTQIVGITPTIKVIPRDINNLVLETLTDSRVSFYYRLDAPNGIIYLTDSAGFDNYYDEVLVGISYLAGYATVPEPVRQAVLSIASALNNLACTEGLSNVRMGDISFAHERNLFGGHVGEMLDNFMNNFQV